MSRIATQTRNTDSKGRITLGDAYANRTILVEERGDEIVLRLARVIPESEGWLYDNGKSLSAVRNGLRQAQKGDFSSGPDLTAAAKLARHLKDE